MTELQEAEISCETCLHAFLAHDAETNICCLDHSYIVASIAKARYALTCIMLDVLSHDCLLGWRTTTDTHRLGFLDRCEESLL